MYKLSIVPPSLKFGSEVELTGQEDRWQIVRVAGFNPPSGSVNVTRLAGQDGARFNSEYLGTRNIVITLKINGSASHTVGENRIYLEDLFEQKSKIAMKYTGARAVTFTGYVESVECLEFSSSVTMQISIICPDPYLYDQNVTITKGRAISVRNETVMPLGMIMRVSVTGSLTGLVVKRNGTEKMRITYAFQSGDLITIDTRPGNKSVTLRRSGLTTNLFPYLSDTSEFITVQAATTAAAAQVSVEFENINTSHVGISTDTEIETQYRYTGA